MKYRFSIFLTLFCMCYFTNRAENLVIRFKANKNVWTEPQLNCFNIETQQLVAAYEMQFVGEESEMKTWEKLVDDDDVLQLIGSGLLSVAVYQSSYVSDYHEEGPLQTLQRQITDTAMYCFTSANLNGRANISYDGSYRYTTEENEYDSIMGDVKCRQAGKLFFIECDDSDHHIYYASLEGLAGSDLRAEIKQIENAGKRVTSYNSLRDAYAISDYRPFGTIWDMYSLRSGTYRYPEGESGDEVESRADYNREHSLPKSWWGHENATSNAAFSDIVHVIPANGNVNSNRSDFPYGEVGTVTKTFGNGSLKGYSGFGDYTGWAYEPIDEYKGDLARIYFYMLTAYSDLNFASSDMGAVTFVYDGSQSEFTVYGNQLMMKWARQDEVSDKERNRNDAIQSVQGNRNPFVDLPNLAEYLWGDKAGLPYSFDDRYATGVEKVDTDEQERAVTAWKSDGAILVNCPVPGCRVEIYGVGGQLLYTGYVTQPRMLTIRAVQAFSIVRVVLPSGAAKTFKCL